MPSAVPTSKPSAVPSSSGPTTRPSSVPSEIPSQDPSAVPSFSPTESPSNIPSSFPTSSPSVVPTDGPSPIPTSRPSSGPSSGPSESPSQTPSVAPSLAPTGSPSEMPSAVPTSKPSAVPSSGPTTRPSSVPSEIPSQDPSAVPSFSPTESPSNIPSSFPTSTPSVVPTDGPSPIPTSRPSSGPSAGPSESPSQRPNAAPSLAPTGSPSEVPSAVPTSKPSVSTFPSQSPSAGPSVAPTNFPTRSTYMKRMYLERDGSTYFSGRELPCPHEDKDHMLIDYDDGVPDGVKEIEVTRCDGSTQKNGGHPAKLDIKFMEAPNTVCEYEFVALDDTGLQLEIWTVNVVLLNKKCRRRHLVSAQDSSSRRDERFFGLFMELVLQSRFSGASNWLSFTTSFLQRDPDPIDIGVYNTRLFISSSEGNRRQKASLVSILTEDGGWQDVTGTRALLRIGNLPDPYAYDENDNFLPFRIRFVGMTLMLVSGILALASMTLLYWRRRHGRVCPDHFFLQLLCLGSACISSSIIFISFDEGSGMSTRVIETFCSCSSWTFFCSQNFVGTLLLFKASRTQRSEDSPRKIVPLNGAYFFPFGVMATLFVWSVRDPSTWRRVYISNLPPETTGFCASEHSSIYLGSVIMLTVCLFCSVLFTSWKTQNLATTKPGTISVCCTVLQGYCIGIPMVTILKADPSPVGSYVVQVILIWLVAVSILTALVWPALSDTFSGNQRRFRFTRGL